MGTKTRAVGADSVLRGKTEVTYGTAPTSAYFLLPFRSFALDSERNLGYDPLLGQGRDAADPFYEAINVNGEVSIPIDVQAFGWWLHGLFGGTDPAETTHATGTYVFSGQPTADTGTITLNGTVWTFKTSGATGAQTNIGLTLADTLSALVTDLNASADVQVTKCTYSCNATTLFLYHEAAGAGGNAFTTVASAPSNATPSGATLTGGAAAGLYHHTWTSGDVVPSRTLEVGHTQLSTTKFMRYSGAVVGSLSFDMTRTGPANATVNLTAQGRNDAAVTIEGSTSTSFTITRFSYGGGSVKVGNTQVANITAGSIELNNSLEPIETIRSDGKIDAIDTGEFKATGSITVRMGTDTTLSAAIDAETPVTLEYSFTHPSGYSFKLVLPRVFLPKPKSSITGPGGIEQVFEWQASKGQATNFTYLCRATLINNYSSAYA